MKKILLLSGVLLAFSASMALAGGVNFYWSSVGGCFADGGTLTNKTFACNSNTLGGATMVGTYSTTNDIPDFVGIEVVIDLQSNSASLPAWWQFFNAGACRQSALSASSDFTTAPQGCFDVFAGQSAGGISAYQTSTTFPAVPNGLPNAARLKMAFAVANSVDEPPATETYGFKGTISGVKTVGTGNCAGCATSVTIVLNEIKAAGLAGYAEHETAPMSNDCLSWQGSGVPCNATPVQNRTWGSIKSLYR
jgi:hypothetical protein